MSPEEESFEKSYATKQKDPVPVDEDQDVVDAEEIDEEAANSDAQLARDEDQAIDKSNIIDNKTRHAQPTGGTYREPGDEEGLPTDD